ncbi:hypothetical protein [Lutibacter sp.]
MIWWLHKKINAGALQYTLFIAVLIAILLGSFLTLTYVQSQFKIQTDFRVQSIKNASIGFDYVSYKEIALDQDTEVVLDKTIDSKLVLNKKYWGIFEILTVASSVKNAPFYKMGLLGGYLKDKPALYLKENNSALVLVGNTKIEGTAFLPKKQVKRGNIAGHSYYGNELIYGQELSSTETLPEITNKKHLELLSKGLTGNSNTVPLELVEGMNEINSFGLPTKEYKTIHILELHHLELTGNYRIQSDSIIKIYSTAYLKDVLLIAPHIEILDNVSGNFQAIASKSILVGKDCRLDYPTALVVYEKKQETSKKKTQSKIINQLTINSNTSIKGVVAFLSENTSSNYNPQIRIEENTLVYGEVYCEKNLALKGTVLGSVYTDAFIAKQYGSVYQNHIYNGQILNSKLPPEYIGLQFKNTTLKVSKWLY